MKKILFVSAMALALSASSAFAKTADELRVYINPGHGSWCSNDRPMEIYAEIDGVMTVVSPDTRSNSVVHTPDTTAFYESNTNLRKGFGVLEKLIQYGLKFDRSLNQTGDNIYLIGAAKDMNNNIVMSHVKCGPYPNDPEMNEICNRSLGEINAEVDANNFDMFISIHSNAATEGTTTNYPLFLYRGYDNVNTEDEGVTVEYMTNSRNMSLACWPYAIANKHMMWTHYTGANDTNVRGDINFYGSSSTNGRGHKGYLGVLKSGVPGFLVEGYFHTYQPGRHKAMNWDVDYLEGYCYARGAADFFGLTKENTGCIYGVVRDLHETFAEKYFKPNVATVDRFLPINGAVAILKKGGVEVARYTTDNHYNGAFVFMDIEPGDYTIAIEHPDYKPLDSELAVTVTAATTVYPDVQIESKSYEPPTVVYVNYPDEYQTAAEGVANTYAVKQTYTDEAIAELEGKTVRRMIQHGDYLYILAHAADSTATLIVYKPAAKQVVATVSTEGMDGTEYNCSDIQVTSDGVLLACNKELTQYDDSYKEATDKRRGTFRVYKWANDANGLPTGDPECWLTSKHTGNWFRSYSGDTFCYSGTSIEGAALFSCETTGSSKNLRTMYMGIVNGEKAGESFHQPWYGGSANGFTVATIGPNYNFVTSPLNDDRYYIVGDGEMPVVECEYTHTNKAEVFSAANDALEASLGGAGIFKYIGGSIMVTPETTDGKVTGVKLTNISKNIAAAKNIKVVDGAIEGAEAQSAHAAGRTVVTWDDLHQNITGGWMELYLLRDNKLTLYTTQGVSQPVAPAVYAYDLLATEAEGGYAITFKATGDAPAATLEVYNNGETTELPLGEVKAGENTVNVAKDQLPAGESTWAITVESEAIAASARVFDANAGMSSYTRGGVAFINDPESPSFGKTVISYGYAQGLNLYDQDLNLLGNYWNGAKPFVAGNGSSTMRVATWKGKAYVSDWSDGGAGYWIFDPENVEAGPVNFLAGTNNGTGAFVLDGAIIGGGSTGFAFLENDGKEYMWTYCEDYPTGNNGNVFIAYDITGVDQINKAPDINIGQSGFANMNVALYPFSGGFIAGQTRGAGNNAPGCPSFKFFNKDGEVIYNSGSELGDVLNSSTGGIAINPDETLLAVASLNGIEIYGVAFDDVFGDPVLTHLYNIPNSVSRGYASEWTELDFDQAGNLLGYERGSGLQKFAIRNDAPKATTPARKANTLVGTTTGVDEIAAETVAEGAVVYYNLQGIRVDANNLTPGIYVKVQGKKAQKVVVR